MNLKAYLFIANDKWFDFEKLLEDTNGLITWWKKPKRIAKGERVYMYLSGGSKCIKYEFVVVTNNKTLDNCNIDYSKYITDPKVLKKNKKAPLNTPMVELKLIREIKNINLTSPKLMKENGQIMGMLMSNRELKPPSIRWIDLIK